MSKLKKWIRMHISRVIGGVAGGAAAWLGMPEGMAQDMETAATTVVVVLVYGVVHRGLDALGINPDDSAA